jgi:Flp pilus assembly protein TadG
MKLPFTKGRAGAPRKNRGQIMVLFALLASVIILFMGAGLDIGLFYREKTRISKSLDGTAIRLANRITMTEAQRQEVIRTVLSNTDSRWSSITWSGTTGTTPSGMTITYTIETFGPLGNQDAVRVTLSAVSKAPVFFTSLAGIKDVKVASSSVAERFPGIIVLILDVSGSMRGSRWSNMVQGAKDFVNNESFDETRDRMAIFIFGSRAAPLYPQPDSNGEVVAQKNFRTAAITELNKLYDGSGTRPFYGFNGSTSASEGVRVAFQAVEKSLPTAAADRKLFKISYVFLTDGAFNTFRTFAVGTGYGWNSSVTTETHDGSSFTKSSLGTPSWHGDKILSVGVDGWGALINFTRPGVGTSATSAGPGPFNLKTLIGDRNYSIMPGVSCTIHAQTFTNPDGTASFGRWGRRPNSGNVYWPMIWSNVIYNKNGSVVPMPSFNWRHDTNNPLPRQGDYMMTRKRTTTTGAFNVFDNSDASVNYSNDQWARIRWEMLQLRYGYMLYMPSPIYNSSMNYSKKTGTNQSEQNLDDAWLNYYSGAGRIYANTYGSKVSKEDGDARDRGIYIERTDASGMTQKGSFNYNYWNRALARLTDHYPSYYYGSEWSSIAGDDKIWLATDSNWTGNQTMKSDGTWEGTEDAKRNPDSADYELKSSLFPHLGLPRYIYRPSTGLWTRFYGVYDPNTAKLRSNSNPYENKNSMDMMFTDEGNFLTEAQCWIARKQHNAAVYTIAYEVSGVEAVLRRMANETAAGGRFYADQKRGMYRSATTTTVKQVFNEIASKIGVAITQ